MGCWDDVRRRRFAYLDEMVVLCMASAVTGIYSHYYCAFGGLRSSWFDGASDGIGNRQFVVDGFLCYIDFLGELSLADYYIF